LGALSALRTDCRQALFKTTLNRLKLLERGLWLGRLEILAFFFHLILLPSQVLQRLRSESQEKIHQGSFVIILRNVQWSLGLLILMVDVGATVLNQEFCGLQLSSTDCIVERCLTVFVASIGVCGIALD